MTESPNKHKYPVTRATRMIKKARTVPPQDFLDSGSSDTDSSQDMDLFATMYQEKVQRKYGSSSQENVADHKHILKEASSSEDSGDDSKDAADSDSADSDGSDYAISDVDKDRSSESSEANSDATDSDSSDCANRDVDRGRSSEGLGVNSDASSEHTSSDVDADGMTGVEEGEEVSSAEESDGSASGNVDNKESESASEENDDGLHDPSHGSDQEQVKSEVNQEDEMNAIRKELADLPFLELQKLKDKLGVKVYNEAMFGGRSMGTERSGPKKVFKRENKNRPMEMSSKVRISNHRQIIPVKKKVARDPRFDDLSGEYSEEHFNKCYSFLKDVKQEEKEKLLKKHKKEKNPEKKEKLEYLIHRMTQQEHAERMKESQDQRKRETRRKEQELVKQGKRPFYLKQSDKKTLELAEKYQGLKKSGKVDNYLSRKRKKNASKDWKRLPMASDI